MGYKDNKEYKENILPIIQMLRSKIAYVRARKVINATFYEMMETCIKQAKAKEKLEVLPYF
ncbi:type III-A CRISPR-associated protein Csm2 [Helicobacter cetorum]|uniref:CRISPR system Cms protein Csm2 n=1 Tax=Helicobacter cetorum (strain ATCC BAA-540 / CCUG 52418 / MIT 99-5656) TaxID=1163745 RepID=I0EUK4_HELCM|nr:type III-A CRISPR-associated protein Csm2 [Helicobacter cetorum]AFI06623.1 hypothetical protein HCD_08195 [Helicobacter cetorum MIT 99-5656]